MDPDLHDPDVLTATMRAHGYLADDGTAVAIGLALELGRPLLLEGAPGVGKTSAATTLAAVRGAELVRLQCYEGIDRAQALYAWDHARQLLHLRAVEASGRRPVDHESSLYDRRFLLARPLLRALELGDRAVLLVDEVDRADDEFDAFLLELLGDAQVTIPELGTIRAERPPTVLLTSNRTRELSDALRRRCLYHWIEHPEASREVEIIRLRAPEVPAALATEVAALVGDLRGAGMHQPPGIAESVDWARVLRAEGGTLDTRRAAATLGVVVKDRDDLAVARAVLDARAAG